QVQRCNAAARELGLEVCVVKGRMLTYDESTACRQRGSTQRGLSSEVALTIPAWAMPAIQQAQAGIVRATSLDRPRWVLTIPAWAMPAIQQARSAGQHERHSGAVVDSDTPTRGHDSTAVPLMLAGAAGLLDGRHGPGGNSQGHLAGQTALGAAALATGGGLVVGEHAALDHTHLEAQLARGSVAPLDLALLTEQGAGQDFGAHDAPAPGAPVGVHALEGCPAAEHVGTDRVLLEDLGAGRDHDLDHEVEPV